MTYLKNIGLIQFVAVNHPTWSQTYRASCDCHTFDHTQPSANCLSCLTLSLLSCQGRHSRICMFPGAGHLPWARLSHSLPLPPRHVISALSSKEGMLTCAHTHQIVCKCLNTVLKHSPVLPLCSCQQNQYQPHTQNIFPLSSSQQPMATT